MEMNMRVLTEHSRFHHHVVPALIMLALCFSLPFLPHTTLAQAGAAGNTGLAFLKIPVGARGAALGEAVVADISGAAASYWNPSGLAGAGNEVFFVHSELIDDITNDFLAVKFRAMQSDWAFFIQLQSVGGILQRQKASVEPLSEITSHAFAIGLSHARLLARHLEVGVTAKYLNEQIFGYSTNGFAADAGLTYHLPRIQGMALAISLHNAGRMAPFKSKRPKLPAFVRAGVAFQPAWTPGQHRLKFFAAVRKLFDAQTTFGAGVEILTREMVFLRLGYQASRETQDIAGGIGLRKGRYQLDYAYVPFSLGLGSSHRLAIGIGI